MIPVKPCGFFVLVEMEEIEKETDWGFVLQTVEESKREQGGACFGIIRAIGPIAYRGFKGCNSAEEWGVKVGDRFMTHRYAGDPINKRGFENFRLIQDSDITATIEEEANE